MVSTWPWIVVTIHDRHVIKKWWSSDQKWSWVITVERGWTCIKTKTEASRGFTTVYRGWTEFIGTKWQNKCLQYINTIEIHSKHSLIRYSNWSDLLYWPAGSILKILETKAIKRQSYFYSNNHVQMIVL